MRFIPALITGAAMGGFETTWSMSKRSEARRSGPRNDPFLDAKTYNSSPRIDLSTGLGSAFAASL